MAFSRSSWYTTEEHLKFSVSSKVTVTVVSGDITQMQADAVVVGDDNYLSGIGAVACALSVAGGHEYSKARADMIRKEVPVGISSRASMKPVYCCVAGPKLKYKRVYHAVLPQVTGLYSKVLWQQGIAGLYTSVCAEADNTNQEACVVVPILGSGTGRGDFADTVWAALNGIRAYHGFHLSDVILVERDREKAKKIVSVCQGWIKRQQTVHNNTNCKILPAGSVSGSPLGASVTGNIFQHQTPSSSQSSGLLGSPHATSPSGSQGTSWSSSNVTMPGSSTIGTQNRGYSGNHSSSSSNSGSSSASSRHDWRDTQQQATNNPSSGLLASPHNPGLSGSQSTTRSSSSTLLTRQTSAESPWDSGDQSSTGRPSSSSTHRSASFHGHSWRGPPRHANRKDEYSGKPNYHMEKVARGAQERRKPGQERIGQEHNDVMSAMWTENSFEGRESQGHSSGRRADDSEHQHSRRRDPRDNRDITPMDVDEGPGSTSSWSYSKPELQERKETNPNPPNIVVMNELSEESSDDETSPHPGNGRKTATDRWESGTSARLSKPGSGHAATPRTHMGFPTETHGQRGSRNNSSPFDEESPPPCSPGGTFASRSNTEEEGDYEWMASAKSPVSKEILGRHGTSGNSASSSLFSSMGKIEGNSRSTYDKEFSSLGSSSQSATGNNWGRSDSSGRYGASGNQSSRLYSSMSGIEGTQRYLLDRDFSSLGSSSGSFANSNTSGHQGRAGSQPSSLLSLSVTEGRQHSEQGKDFSSMRSLSHSGSGSSHDSFNYHRSVSSDNGLSNSGSDIGGAAGSGSAWENIEERTLSSPEGKMVVTHNSKIKLGGCNVLVLEFSFPNGVQGSTHPAPGQPYKGTFRRAFLPDNAEGRDVLELLREAFRQNLVFTIWNSLNEDIVETASDIKLVTSHRDPYDRDYLQKLRSVLIKKCTLA